MNGAESKLKIMFLSQYFPPEIGAASARVSELANMLKKFGHEITVVTEFPNYPHGVISEAHRGKLFLKEKENGIDVVRTFVLASERGTFFQRMLFYISFMISSIFGGLFTKKCDIIIASSPPLFVALSGYVLSKVKRSIFVFEVRDIWPESAKSLGQLRGRVFIWLSEKLETFLYRRARQIIVVTKGFIENLVGKKIEREKIALVSNGVDVDFFKPSPKDQNILKKYNLENKFIVSYIGNIGLAQGIHVIIECAEILKEYQDIVFILVGDGVVKKQSVVRVERLGLSNVLFIETQPKSKIASFLSLSDICLVPLMKTQLFKITVPSKLYESLACGKPVILTVDGEARHILEEAKSGVFVEPENPQELAKAVLKLYNNPDLLKGYGQNGRDYVERYYSRKKQAHTLESLLQSLAS